MLRLTPWHMLQELPHFINGIITQITVKVKTSSSVSLQVFLEMTRGILSLVAEWTVIFEPGAVLHHVILETPRRSEHCIA